MIDHVPGFFVLSAFFFLVFFAVTMLSDRQKKEGNLITLLKRIPWDTVRKIFCLWAVIIFLRKLTYYFHLNGIIQTKDTLFWVDKKEKVIVLFSLGIIISSIGLIKEIVAELKTPHKKPGNFTWLFVLIVSLVALISHKIPFKQFLIFSTITPLLVLKMLCSGRYLGLLTALLTALYIANKHKKLKTGEAKASANLFTVPVLIIIVILLLGHYKFTGDWKAKFTGSIRAAKSTRSLKYLNDAAATIRNESDKSRMFKDIAVAAARQGDIPLALETAETIGMTHKKNRAYAFKEIAAAASKTGDMKSAENILNRSITEAGALNNTDMPDTSREIILTLLKTGNARWSPEIFQKLFDMVDMTPGKNRKIAFIKEIIPAASAASNRHAAGEIIEHSVYTIDELGYNKDTLPLFREIVRVVSNRRDITWTEEFYFQLIDGALTVEDKEEKSGLLSDIAVAIAKTGNIKWALSIAHSIPNSGIKSLVLMNIKEIKGNE